MYLGFSSTYVFVCYKLIIFSYCRWSETSFGRGGDSRRSSSPMNTIEPGRGPEARFSPLKTISAHSILVRLLKFDKDVFFSSIDVIGVIIFLDTRKSLISTFYFSLEESSMLTNLPHSLILTSFTS